MSHHRLELADREADRAVASDAHDGLARHRLRGTHCGAVPLAHAPEPAVGDIASTTREPQCVVQPVLAHGTVADDDRVVDARLHPTATRAAA